MSNGEKTQGTETYPVERLQHRTSTSRRKFSRIAWVSAATIASVTAVTAGWVAVKASEMSTQLETASQLIPELKEQVLKQDAAAAEKTVTDLREATGRAREAGNDPVWTLAGAFPWLGANFQAVSALATSADDVTKFGAVPLVGALESLNWKTLAPKDGQIDLSPLINISPRLRTASQAVSQSSDRLDEINAAQLLPQIADPLTRAREQLRVLRKELASAADVATVAPGMLGAEGPRKYLLLIQNNAESRASGGIPGALAVMEIDNGRMSLAEQTSATDMGAMSPVIDIEPEQQQIYSRRVGKFMQDVNLTPDFPTSAATALAMWQQKTNSSLDGVVSVDPVALSYMLPATGPVRLPDSNSSGITAGLPAELTAKNVVNTLLSDVYSAIPDPGLQDLYFADVAKELFGSLSRGQVDATRLFHGVSLGVEEGRIMIWSATRNEQAVISKYPLSGSISGTNISPAQFGVYFNDGTGAKMDYYVRRTVQAFKECTNDGYGQVRLRVTSTNTAPSDAATSLPAYVTGGGVFGVPPGTVQTNIVAYGPVQSQVETAEADGKKISFASQLHSGRPVGTVTMALPPGKTSTIDFSFGKIVQHMRPEVSVTPTVQAREDVVLDTITEECAPAS